MTRNQYRIGLLIMLVLFLIADWVFSINPFPIICYFIGLFIGTTVRFKEDKA